MKMQSGSVNLFLDNATIHTENINFGKYNFGKYSNIKIAFLPRNTTSRLQPLDASIINNFNVKYRKELMHYLLARIDDDLNAYEIVNEIYVSQAIEWITSAWKEVSKDTIKNCFYKYGVAEQPVSIDHDEGFDEEFNNLFKELSEELQIDGNTDADEYSNLDHEVCTSFPPINSDEVDLRRVSMATYIQEYCAKLKATTTMMKATRMKVMYLRLAPKKL